MSSGKLLRVHSYRNRDEALDAFSRLPETLAFANSDSPIQARIAGRAGVPGSPFGPMITTELDDEGVRDRRHR